MFTVALTFAAIAAVIHLWIFVLESMLWTSPRGRTTFGTTEEEAAATRAMAFNQGFYNLFLAVLIAAGLVAQAIGAVTVGHTLIFAGAGSMAAAGFVLLAADRTKIRPALIQLTPPLIAVIALLTVIV